LINYSFELFEFSDSLTPENTLETDPPSQTTSIISDFTEGTHFRTKAEDITNSLTLDLEDRLLTIVLDESGSMTWNDNNRDRFTYLNRLLAKLDSSYPGQISANLIGFGGILTRTDLFITQANVDFLTTVETSSIDFNKFLQSIFQDSVFDFAGVRVVRRTDRFPEHPADGVIVSEGIFEATKGNVIY